MYFTQQCSTLKNQGTHLLGVKIIFLFTMIDQSIEPYGLKAIGYLFVLVWGCCGRDHMVVVSLNPTQARCTRYNIMWSSLSVTCDRSMIFSWHSTNKIDHHNITEILLKVALNTMTLTLFLCLKNCQLEHLLQYIQFSDWTVLEDQFKTCTTRPAIWITKGHN